MKYWFFDGNDVIGPFTPKELLARTGFSSVSLVCPENFSDKEDNWKMAYSFPDFNFSAPEKTEPPLSPSDTASFDRELDTLLKEQLAVEEPQDPSGLNEPPSFTLPKKPAKPGPIEDYFNHINQEDLGGILGIPDPDENSDMNLARALKSQFDATNPPTDKQISTEPIENDPFDEFTVEEDSSEKGEVVSSEKKTDKPSVKNTTKQELPASVALSSVEEDEPLSFAEKANQKKEDKHSPTEVEETSDKSDSAENTAALDVLPSEDAPTFSLPVVGEENKTPVEEQDTFRSKFLAEVGNISSEPVPQEKKQTEEPVEKESSQEAEEMIEQQETVEPEEILADTTPESTEKKPETEEKAPQTEEEKEKSSVFEKTFEKPVLNQVRTALKQTPEIEAFLTQRIKKNEKTKTSKLVLLIVLFFLLLVVLFIFSNKTEEETVSVQPSAAAKQTDIPISQLPDIPTPPPAENAPFVPPPALIQTAEEKALDIVQNHPLSGGRGTVSSYLNRLYSAKFAQGYEAQWDVEPLHKNVYIVKYRLTKTRMEPIVYVFQADTARKKLTAALNNVTLDLVGKIN